MSMKMPTKKFMAMQQRNHIQKRLGDACATAQADGTKWTLGAQALQLEFTLHDGHFCLAGLRNTLTTPAKEYGLGQAAGDLLPLGVGGWSFVSDEIAPAMDGGRSALQVAVTLENAGLRLTIRARAYPGTSVIRLSARIENTGATPRSVSAIPFAAALFSAQDDFSLRWLAGGHAAPDQGQMFCEQIKTDYSRSLRTTASAEFSPWLILQRNRAPGDGLMVALDFLGQWEMAVTRRNGGPVNLVAAMRYPDQLELKPGQALEFPAITLATFHGDLDDLGVRLYDWQYLYRWDCTNPDYFARTRCATLWFYCSRNLQEQFTARLAGLNMGLEPFSEVGYEILWDDAGWSSYPGWPPDNYGSVFANTYEGPDFARTQRYLHKKDMKWLLWFAGMPSDALLDTKVGAWGDLEWRTDGVDFDGPNGFDKDRRFRERVEHFLRVHPESSFHTCSGGANYAHTFDAYRYGTFHYQSDLGRGPYTNYYFSYFEPPDKVGDLLQGFAALYDSKDGSYTHAERKKNPTGAPPAIEDLRYVKQTARHTLTAVPDPSYGMYCEKGDVEMVRQDLELYRFLLHEGVAGRWSYMFHPRVAGDAEHFYLQRTSRDRRKACIILKCQRKGKIRLYPKGLLPGKTYAVSFAVSPRRENRKGAELMTRGIALNNFAARELIFLNLENRPGSGRDTTPPAAPGTVYARRENNLGFSGIGIYWSGAAGKKWIRYHEVAREGRVIARVSIGRHWFDHATGWSLDARYTVRTVDGNGNTSPWTAAQWIESEPATYEALGGHFPVPGCEGWRAEYSTDGRKFTPMTWVKPAHNPAADFGGTPNQKGGVEGYWEGLGGARVGRGWQQASLRADCVRAWTAPKAGTVAVVGRAVKEWYRFEKGQPMRVRILLNDRQVWPRTGAAAVRPKDFNGAAHDLKLRVARGDVIRFVLGRGSDIDSDLLAWMPIVRYDELQTALPQSLVRILCGGKRAYTDSCGNRWDADRDYRAGTALPKTPGVSACLPGKQDTELYARGRARKDFSYSIPVSPGIYTVRLKFAEPRYQEYFERPMHVAINGLCVLNDFDIAHAARASRTGVDKAFHYIVPDVEGNIVLRFLGAKRHDGRTAEALAQAIEILPEFRSCVRINVGSRQAFIDWNSFVWTADTHDSGGRLLRSSRPVSQASPTLYDQPLYQTARTGRRISYRVPVQPGLYAVHLKFAELWLAEKEPRPMRVEINGTTMLHGFDPAAAGQRSMSADRRFEKITPDARGFIAIDVVAEGHHGAILQAIEIE